MGKWQVYNGKVTTLQLDITNDSQGASPLPAGDLKALLNRFAPKNNKKQDRNNINDPQKEHCLGTASKIFYQFRFSFWVAA